ncbi:hypothetical protein Hanom_Chr03g00237401 [Helianthus anomalus]
MYVRKISQEVDSEVPYHYSSWKNVDANYKKAILATIAHGCYKDVEEAKKHPPESLNPEAWCKLIDGLFTTPAYMNRSEKNKANRSKQLYGSYHGSQSLADRRHKEVTTRTKLLF